MLPRCLAVSSSSAFTLDSVRSFGWNESRRQRTPRTQRGLGRALGHDQGASGAHGAHGPQLRWSQPSSPTERDGQFHPSVSGIRKTMRKTQQFMQTAPCFWQPVLMWSSRSQSPPEVKAENHSCTNQRNLCWSFQDNHECQIGGTYWTELCPGNEHCENLRCPAVNQHHGEPRCFFEQIGVLSPRKNLVFFTCLRCLRVVNWCQLTLSDFKDVLILWQMNHRIFGVQACAGKFLSA